MSPDFFAAPEGAVSLSESQFDGGTGLTSAAWGAMILLQELGHLTGAVPPDAGNKDLIRANTQAVLDNCFETPGNGLYR